MGNEAHAEFGILFDESWSQRRNALHCFGYVLLIPYKNAWFELAMNCLALVIRQFIGFQCGVFCGLTFGVDL